jgi:hypothetical protein
MPQCQFLFSVVFLFQIFTKGNILRIGRNKARSSIFLTRRWSPKGRRRWAGRWPHHSMARAHPWPRLAMAWAPRASIDLALLPIYCPRRENPKRRSLHPRKVPQHRRHRRQVSGDRNLCSSTQPGRGIAPRAISIDSTAIFITVADSHDEEGVVLPRG